MQICHLKISPHYRTGLDAQKEVYYFLYIAYIFRSDICIYYVHMFIVMKACDPILCPAYFFSKCTLQTKYRHRSVGMRQPVIGAYFYDCGCDIYIQH